MSTATGYLLEKDEPKRFFSLMCVFFGLILCWIIFPPLGLFVTGYAGFDAYRYFTRVK